MAYISTLISTAVPHNVSYAGSEWPYTTNDTLLCTDPIYFATNLTLLNSYRTTAGVSTISSANINAGNVYVLKVFLCASIDGSLNFVNVAATQSSNLTSSNLSSDIFSQSLSSLFQNLKHSDLCSSMTQEEILQLCREYKIIFRITSQNSPVTNQSVQDGDIVQDFKLVLDISSAGPYEVEFEWLDMLSPSDFTEAERYAIYKSNFRLPGQEVQRCFYPKNISSLTGVPIAILMHGGGHQSQMYDSYGSLLASYGYFVVQPTFSAPGDYSGRFFGILKQLKEQISKIKSGIFSEKLNYNKIVLFGHSAGGAAAANLIYYIQQNTIVPPVSGLSFSDILCGVFLEHAQPTVPVIPNTTGFTYTNIPAITITASPSTTNSSTPQYFLNGKELRSPTSGIDSFKAHINVRHSAHDDLGHPICSSQYSVFSPQVDAAPDSIGGITSIGYYFTGTGYVANSWTPTLDWVSQNVLKYISIIFKNKITNLLNNTANDYLSPVIQNLQATATNHPKMTLGSNLFDIDALANTGGFSAGTTYDFIKESYKTDGSGDCNTLINAEYSGTINFSDYVNLYYNKGNVIFDYSGSGEKGFTYAYSSSSPLDLTVNNTAKHLNIVVGLVSIVYPSSSLTELLSQTIYNHFCIQATDKNGQAATVNSKQRNIGIPNSNKDGYNYADGSYINNLLNAPSYMPGTNLSFNLQDFKIINPNIDLTQITNLRLRFSPTHGTSALSYNRFVYNGMFLS